MPRLHPARAVLLIVSLIVVLGGVLTAAAQSGLLFTAAFDPAGAVMVRRPFCNGGSTTLVPYDARPFSVSVEGVYTFNVSNITGIVANDSDLILGVYSPTFDPANPNPTCVAVNDDALGFLPQLSLNLRPGLRYVLVVSNYDADESGTADVSYTGPGRIDIGQGGGAFTDARINPDAQAPVVLYCAANVLNVYAVTGGAGTFAFSIDTAAADTTAGAVLAESGAIRLTRLSDGRFQIEAPLPDGKGYLFVWDACQPTRSQTFTADPAFGAPVLAQERSY